MARTVRGKARARRQKIGAAPIVEDAKLPRMGDAEPVPQKVGRTLSFMPAEPKAVAGTKNRMTAFKRTTSPARQRVPKDGYPEQEPPKPPRASGRAAGGSKGARDGYVRLRVMVDKGDLSIVGAKFVEGPLAQPAVITAGLSYEVALGTQRIAAGDIVDAGEWRSYPDPEGRAGLQGHHLTRLDTYEIAVRVPANALSKSALPKMQINLYRWQGKQPAEVVAGRPLKSQLAGRVQTVATLKGIRLARLPKQAQSELMRALE
jgi:hypothetical protein